MDRITKLIKQSLQAVKMPGREGQQPARGLYSKRVKSSLQANLLTIIGKYSCKAVVCRATWGAESADDVSNRISSLRMQIDDELAKMRDVQFFVSSITGTTSNKKSTLKENNRRPSPGISYLIAYSPNSNLCTRDTLFTVIQRFGFNPNVDEIKAGTRKDGDIQKIMFQAVKDHNSSWAIDLVEKSNRHCLETAQGRMQSMEENFKSLLDTLYDRSILCPTPSRLVIVNNWLLNLELEQSHHQLVQDGFKVNMQLYMFVKLFL